MINQGFYRTVLATVAVTFVSASLFAGDGIGFIDMERVFQGYYKTARDDSAFKTQKEAYEGEAKRIAEEIELIKTKRDEHRDASLNIALSDDVRKEHRQKVEESDALYQEKKRELQGFLKKIDKELQGKYLQLRQGIVDEISTFVRSYAEREGLKAVIDTSGMSRNMIPVVVYFEPASDLTDTVLTELNRGHEDELPKPDEAKAEE
ncbi:MAG: OmpH family outer membrane protein [Lentisphaerae bacterium]|nr:OmpH family outer membrane protein [Lentisphaerota bacterium]MBT4819422.1 OmpH family outer membrane protein [Lentisphaerota bacterium]MBT5605185.1 OmpH family outer membrane protein [Lentisphaerota bacterium]MBT7054363.1 OmpH family outer membrane protein [Lentisphaerota bacterium]MBT7844853.1 OmpH family outer membrane protein [Lentisphaerota bacterium]